MVFGNSLNRMIFSELVKVFLMSLGSLTGLFLLAGIIQQAIQLGLSPAQILAALPLFIPSTLPYTIPATTLFASCVVYGRLSHDNEVVAVKAAGVHLFRILQPAILLGIITTTITGVLYYAIIPLSQQRLQEELLKDPEEAIYSTLRRERCLRHPHLDYVIYVRDVQGRRLIDVVLKQRAHAKGLKPGQDILLGYDFVFRARQAQLRVDTAERMIYIDNPSGFVVYNATTQGTSALNAPVPVQLPENFNASDARTRPSAMTWLQLGPRIETLDSSRDEKAKERETARRKASQMPEGPLRAAVANQDAHYKAQIENITRLIRNVQAEYYMRPALALGCFVFALIGCPVGIWATRADYLSSFVICFLPTVLVYYPLLFAGSNLGKDGKIPLGFGCLLADIVVGGVGAALTWRLLRR